ncbi:MAG: hypothetical protein P1P63_00240 [Treponemataceae bacterium]
MQGDIGSFPRVCEKTSGHRAGTAKDARRIRQNNAKNRSVFGGRRGKRFEIFPALFSRYEYALRALFGEYPDEKLV